MKTEFDRDEWFVICRELKPDLTDAEFERMWREFMKLKEAILHEN